VFTYCPQNLLHCDDLIHIPNLSGVGFAAAGPTPNLDDTLHFLFLSDFREHIFKKLFTMLEGLYQICDSMEQGPS
jgi:hypothetical protein